MDLTFQIPMQYCSLQHQTFYFHQPDTSTAERCLCFGPATSFFVELLVIALCLFPVAHWIPSDPGEIIFWCPIFLPFHTVHGVLEARTLKWLAIAFSSGPRLVRSLQYDLSIRVPLHGTAHSFTEVGKPLHHDKAVIHEGDVMCILSEMFVSEKKGHSEAR